MSNLEPEVGKARTVGTSPKAVGAGVAGGILGLIVAVLNGLSDQPDLLGTMPAWLQGVILVVVGVLGAGGTAYAARPGLVQRVPADRY